MTGLSSWRQMVSVIRELECPTRRAISSTATTDSDITETNVCLSSRGVRHLRFLLDTDVQAQAALDDHWRRSLHDLQPTLAGIYE